MTAELRIVVSDTGETLKIPNQALRFRPDSADATLKQAKAVPASSPGTAAAVWVVGDDGRPSPISVQLGQSDDNTTQVLQGPITEGQELIVGVENSQSPGFLGVRFGF
jgi:HlyD family secretion protein